MISFRFWTWSKPVCPKCGSHRIRRQERHTYMQKKWLLWAGLFPFHCGKCKSDFYLTVRHLQTSQDRPDQFFRTLNRE